MAEQSQIFFSIAASFGMAVVLTTCSCENQPAAIELLWETPLLVRHPDQEEETKQTYDPLTRWYCNASADTQLSPERTDGAA